MASWFIEYIKNHNFKLYIPTLTEVLDLSILDSDSINRVNWSLINGCSGLGLSNLNQE